MEEQEEFSLGSLDETPEYVNQEEETHEQEELHPEDVTDLEEEPDTEEYSEDEELDEEESESEEVDSDEVSYTPFISPLIEDGVIWVNPEKEYDDSPEGLNEIFVDNAQHVIQETVSQLPEVLQQVFELAQLGEDPMEAFAQLNGFDYSQIDLEDESTQRELTKDYLIDRFPKWSEERLNKELQNREDLGELRELAEEAQAHFIEQTAGQKEAYLESVRLANQEALERQEQEVATYKKLIQESEGFKGLKFTSNQDKQQFEDYAFKRGKDGLTQYERETMKAEDKLTQAFYSYKKFGFDSVVKGERSKAVVEQKKILKRFQDSNAKSNNVRGIEVERPSKGFKLGKV